MSRRLVNITLDNLGDLPLSCRSCVFWELDPVSKSRAEANDPALEKESWISSVLLEWGSCGKILYVDGVPAAYVLFAPPQYVPRSVAFPTSPVSADAVLLMTARVMSEFSGGGLGRMLIQGMAKDLTRRGVRAIEAFGDKQWTAPACVLPVDYLLAVGFKTVRPHHRNPRLRMELRTALTWREDVEVALERLLGSMSPDRVLLRPSPAAVSSRGPEDVGRTPPTARLWLGSGMENVRFLECLAADYERIRAVAPGNLDRQVPSCPEWTVADLLQHVGQVYLHKAATMRDGAEPSPWPPPGLNDEEPVALLDRAYAELMEEFGRRDPRTSPRPGTTPTRRSASGSAAWPRRRSSTASTPNSPPTPRSPPSPTT